MMPFLPLGRRIVLASASPRRSELLKQMGYSFIVVPSTIDESNHYVDTPEDLACSLALLKAEDVGMHLDDKNTLVIGADTIVVLDGVLGKPRDKEQARAMLTKLQGNTHEVMTAVALWTRDGYRAVTCETTIVEMISLTEQQITDYINLGESYDKAGGYGIQGLASMFISRIIGCYFNVVGLPVHRLYCMLMDFEAYDKLSPIHHGS